MLVRCDTERCSPVNMFPVYGIHVLFVVVHCKHEKRRNDTLPVSRSTRGWAQSGCFSDASRPRYCHCEEQQAVSNTDATVLWKFDASSSEDVEQTAMYHSRLRGDPSAKIGTSSAEQEKRTYGRCSNSEPVGVC